MHFLVDRAIVHKLMQLLCYTPSLNNKEGLSAPEPSYFTWLGNKCSSRIRTSQHGQLLGTLGKAELRVYSDEAVLEHGI